MIRFFRNNRAKDIQTMMQQGTPDAQPLNEQTHLQRFQMCQDVKHHVYKLKADDDQSRIVLLYCEGLCEHQQFIQDVVLPHLTRFYENRGFQNEQEVLESCQLQLESIPFEKWGPKCETDIL